MQADFSLRIILAPLISLPGRGKPSPWEPQFGPSPARQNSSLTKMHTFTVLAPGHPDKIRVPDQDTHAFSCQNSTLLIGKPLALCWGLTWLLCLSNIHILNDGLTAWAASTCNGQNYGTLTAWEGTDRSYHLGPSANVLSIMGDVNKRKL